VSTIVTGLKAESFVNRESGEAPVQGFLHRAESGHQNFLVLTHGAGGNCDSALLIALADGFAAVGVNTLRCNLPYRQRKPTGPPSPSDAKHDQEGLRRGVTLMRKTFSGHAFLGGSSYGGRQASMLVAAEPKLVDGLLLLSYPLHPPGRPAQLRTAHFPALQARTLFVSGTKDSFGSIDELQPALKLIPAATKLIAIEGAAHGLSSKSKHNDWPQRIVTEFLNFFPRE
jgi:predicted alpha/beta-hydrolase family hydrolase